jgi:alpha/beta superfamily hydrolase
VLNEPSADSPARYCAVVCHAHPLHGGTLHTRVVFHLARALAEISIPVLRFNFRGVEKSEGAFGHGTGEADDTRAAVDYMLSRYSLPLILGGFSFGCSVALHVLADGSRAVERFVGVGVPATSSVGTTLPVNLPPAIPKLFISGTQDKYGSVASVQRYFDHLQPPKKLIWFEGADHFLTGRMDEFRASVQQNLFGF